MANEVSVGTIFNGMSNLVSTNSREAGIYVLVVGGLAALGYAAGFSQVTTQVGINYGFLIDQNDTLGSGLFELFSALVGIIAAYMLTRQYIASRHRLASEGNRFWQFLGLSILAVIGLVIGFLFLIVPGIILLVRWSASTGYVIGTEQGITESLSSSWEATKGHGWQIFFAGLIFLIGSMIFAGIVAAVFSLAGLTVAAMISGFVEAAIGALSYAFAVSVYLLVSEGSEELGDVFA